MARIEELIEEIADPKLRDQIAREVKQLKTTKRFGLVYEEHVPETVSLFGLPVRPGSVVQKRREPNDPTRWEVVEVDGETATIRPIGADEPLESVAAIDLLTVKRFEEPIYPGLTPVGEVRRGPEDKPSHTVINGENHHALQLLAYTHAGTVDVIYIDPPYNTGDKSWKYNNRFVDSNDSYRHSKWLAMMEKRLRLAKTLLKPDGVLIITIDEHELHHLGMLLEDLFGSLLRQVVTVVTNPKGVAKRGFSRVEEYALFVLPEEGPDPIAPLPVDLMRDQALSTADVSNPWISLLRRGTGSRPSDRPNMCYPIVIDGTRIVGSGPSLRDRVERGDLPSSDDALNDWIPPTELLDGLPVMWPFRRDGTLGRWGVSAPTLLRLVKAGQARVSRFTPETQSGVVLFLSAKARRRIDDGELEIVDRNDDGSLLLRVVATPTKTPPRVWQRTSHDAGTYGSSLLAAFLGRPRAFDFPKSIYATADALLTVTRMRRDALIVDFFAGSGTTLHAAAMLNAADQGRRTCILVTNNDLTEADAVRSQHAGFAIGDSEYESKGIFEAVTRPRILAAVTGLRADGAPVEGSYLSAYLPDHPYDDGLEENVAFFRLDYLEPDLVELGRQYEAIAPLLWMTAGSVGSWEPWDGKSAWSAPVDSTYAVLFDESQAMVFGAYVESRIDEITHVWIVTDSHSAFLDIEAELPPGLRVSQLYRDYLRNFVINVPAALR